MAMAKKIGFKYVPDKCNPPPCDMGTSAVFADAMPGVNNTTSRPFGWTEYEAAYRPQYVPDPCPARRPCKDPCRPKGVARKAPPREFVNPSARNPRSTFCQTASNVPPPWDERKEKIVVYEPDSVRTLLIHGECKNEHPFVISNSDYNRIMTNAIVRSKEEQDAECMDAIRNKQIALEICREKAEEMRMLDQYRFSASISPEAQADMDEIICRADTIIKEDEPEVRTINQVILHAKVQAIREAQLQEKELMKFEEEEEERRLVAVMQQDMVHALVKDDDNELEIQEQKKKNLMASLKAQIDEQEAYKFYSHELKSREAEEIRRMAEKFELEEAQKRAIEKEKKTKLGLALIEDQILVVERMRMEKERDRQLDEQILEWHKKKALEEERLEKEKELQKKIKALSIKQVIETQKRTADTKGLRDEIRARRHMEQQEREWRQKERSDILKKKEATENLKNDIMGQIQTKQNWIIDQAVYDKALYDKIFDIQDTRMEEERQREEDKKIRDSQYKYDLREQIHQYQMEKIKERKDFYVDGIKFRRDQGIREQELKCFMDRKMGELRASNMPEKYLKYIQHAVDEELQPEWKKKMSKK